MSANSNVFHQFYKEEQLEILFASLEAVALLNGGAMVLGKLPVPGHPTVWISVGQGPTALTVGAGGGCLDIFTLIYPFFPLSPSLWEAARYRLKYCLKGPLNPKSTNQQNLLNGIHSSRKQFAPIALHSLKKVMADSVDANHMPHNFKSNIQYTFIGLNKLGTMKISFS